ncbi:MAG: hypothetical protein ACK6A7_22295, partial [Planctomycetota bacterium]
PHMSGSGSDAVRIVDCEHAAARVASLPRVTPIWNSQCECSKLCRKLQSQKLAFGEWIWARNIFQSNEFHRVANRLFQFT